MSYALILLDTILLLGYGWTLKGNTVCAVSWVFPKSGEACYGLPLGSLVRYLIETFY